MAEFLSPYGANGLNKVVVIDRCAMVVDGLRWRLQNVDGVEVVHLPDVKTADDRLMKMTNVAAIVTEYAPNQELGLEHVKGLVNRFTSPVIILVDHMTSLVLQALRVSGAVGVISKVDEGNRIAELMGKILDDQPLVWDYSDLEEKSQDSQKFTALTKRQLQVLALITQGCSNREISEALNVAEGTVKAHVSAVMKTLGARNRVDLTLQAQRHMQGVV